MPKPDKKDNDGYLLDRKLVPRIRDILSGIGRDTIDVDIATETLQSNFEEYRRKKKAALARSVTRALAIIALGQKLTQTDDSQCGDRKRGSSDIINIEDDGSDVSISDNDNYQDYKPTNAMNNTMNSLYKGSNGAASPAAEPKPKRAKKEAPPTTGNPFKKAPSTSSQHEFVLESSRKSFADVGGCDEQKLEVCRQMLHLKHPEIYASLGVSPPVGFLLHGPPGSGKSLFASAIAGELGLPLLRMAATELVSGISGETEGRMRSMFAAAKAAAPCILFLDEIDAITTKRETAQREMERRIVAQLLACLDDVHTVPDSEDGEPRGVGGVMVIGATNRPDSLDPALRRAGRFDKEIGLGIPDEAARVRILGVLSRDLRLDAQLDFARLGKLTPGFVGADLAAVVREASMNAVNRIFEKITEQEAVESGQKPAIQSELEKILAWLKKETPLGASDLTELCITSGDFHSAVSSVTPSAKREGFATVPGVSWEDVGALGDVREQLSWSILYPVREAAAFEAVGLGGRAEGVLLCGPPGCGKTLLAKAVANESGLNFISVKGPELLSMYVGESERAVRTVFQRARNSAPCVVFFDELDALCPKRSDGESGGSVRVVNQLLTEMDGIQSRSQVFIMAATNRPDIIDPAVMRPGRLDKTIYVGFPSAADRVDILRALTKNGTRPRLSSPELLATVGADKRLDFYTGADLSALVREAALAALKEKMGKVKAAEGAPADSTSQAEKDAIPVVKEAHFEAAIAKLVPSVNASERRKYMALEEKHKTKKESPPAITS